MCVSAMQLTAAVYSQEVKVTLSVKDASFESVIRLLEANTEYTFLYEDRHIAEIGGLNLNFRDPDIKVVLDKCLQGTNLKMCIRDRSRGAALGFLFSHGLFTI